MPARQVSEILSAIRDVHHHLKSRYRELNQDATDERIKLLLKDMEQREGRFEQCVSRYQAEKDPGARATWLQFVPEEVLHIERLSERLTQPQSLSELVESTLRLNCSLSNAYLGLARNSPTPELQELFANLAQLEENNDSHYVEALLDE